MFGVVYYGVFFIFGLALGSFLNVVSLRYDPEKFVFDKSVVGGRSRCPECRHELKWFELVPVLSFVAQGGRCRRCHKRLSFRYPVVEILSGLIFAFVPLRLYAYNLPPASFYSLSALWILGFSALLLVALVDIRLQLIPDEASIFLMVLSVLNILALGSADFSFLSPYGHILGALPFWQSGLAGAALGAFFFWFLIRVTRGQGMGWGDLKLGVALGLLFGWPDTLFLIALGFVIGAAVGLFLMARGRKTMKSIVPFAPFLAVSAVLIFFFGERLLGFYFSFLPL